MLRTACVKLSLDLIFLTRSKKLFEIRSNHIQKISYVGSLNSERKKMLPILQSSQIPCQVLFTNLDTLRFAISNVQGIIVKFVGLHYINIHKMTN